MTRLRAQRDDQHANERDRRADDHAQIEPIAKQQHAEHDGEDRRHQDKRRDHIGLVAIDQPVIGRMGDHRDDQRREGDAAEELQAACKGGRDLSALEKGRR